MRWQYKYIFIHELPDMQYDGWELCGPMKGKKYSGAHPDSVVVRRQVPKAKVDAKEE